MPVPYQYSALRTFDNDPDEDVIDPENNLNMMVDDSTSDDEEIVDSTPATLASKTIGAIDLDNPPDANAVSQGPLYRYGRNTEQRCVLPVFFPVDLLLP